MQSTSYFHSPKFRVTTYEPTPSQSEAFMRATANLSALRNRDRVAYDAMVARMDKGGETWQAVDVDVCRELERLDCLSEQDEVSSMRRGE